jgi:chitin-binding protein
VDVAVVGGDTDSAVVTGLRMATSYTITVLAVNAEGDRSGPSNSAVARTGICESDPPTVPTGLAVTGVDGDCATLAWQPSTDNVGVVGYHAFVDGLPAATTPGNRVTATVCGLAPGRHTAAVSAFDAAGAESGRSNPITFVLP